MTQLLVEYLMSLGAKERKPSTKKHIKRNTEAEFSAFLHTLLTGSKYSLEIIFSKSPAVHEVVRARPGIWSNQRED